MSYVEYLAFKYSTLSETFSYSYLIIILAALVFGYIKKVDNRMQRGTYFLNSAIVVFFVSISQAIWIFSVEAATGGYLAVLVALDIAAWVTAGYWTMTIAKARSNDAFGHSRFAALGFIPIANLWLLFTPSKEQQPYALPNSSYLGGVTAVIIGLVIIGVSRGATVTVDRAIQDQITLAAQSEKAMGLTEVYFNYYAMDEGLKAGLEYLASLETLGKHTNGETSMERIDVGDNNIVYRNRIIDDSVTATNSAWEENIRNYFCTNYKFVLEAGGSIQFDMFTNRNGTITMITASKETCNA